MSFPRIGINNEVDRRRVSLSVERADGFLPCSSFSGPRAQMLESHNPGDRMSPSLGPFPAHTQRRAPHWHEFPHLTGQISNYGLDPEGAVLCLHVVHFIRGRVKRGWERKLRSVDSSHFPVRRSAPLWSRPIAALAQDVCVRACTNPTTLPSHGVSCTYACCRSHSVQRQWM